MPSADRERESSSSSPGSSRTRTTSLSREPLRITAAVPFFVMAKRNIESRSQKVNRGKPLISVGRMHAYEGSLFVGERAVFQQHAVGQSHDPNVVQQDAAAGIRAEAAHIGGVMTDEQGKPLKWAASCRSSPVCSSALPTHWSVIRAR